MVNVELSGQAANDESERFIRSAGLFCLSHSSSQTNKIDQINQMNQQNQIPATRREMATDTFSSSKQRESTGWAVQDIVGEFSSSKAWAAGHGPLASLLSGGFWRRC